MCLFLLLLYSNMVTTCTDVMRYLVDKITLWSCKIPKVLFIYVNISDEFGEIKNRETPALNKTYMNDW